MFKLTSSQVTQTSKHGRHHRLPFKYYAGSQLVELQIGFVKVVSTHVKHMVELQVMQPKAPAFGHSLQKNNISNKKLISLYILKILSIKRFHNNQIYSLRR